MDSSHQPGHRDRPRAGREVEAGFERLLKDAMTQRERAAAGSECVDVETLAAWSEGALPPSERSIVEAHAARCARCQDMLAIMARTAPVEAARGPWNLRHWIMMLAPAAAATAAAVLWFALEPRRQVSDAPAPQVAVRTEVDKLTPPQARPAPQAPVDASPLSRDDRASSARPPSENVAPAPSRRAQAKDIDRYLRKDQPAKPTADSLTATRERKEGAALEEERRKVAGAAGRPAEYTLADEKGSRAAPKTPVAGAAPSSASAEPLAAAKPAAAPSPPPSAPPVAVTSPPSQAQAAQTQQAADLAQSARQVQAFGGDAGRGGGTLNRAGLNESIAVATLAMAPADASVQWRVVSERIVQQSADKGATWATQYMLDESARLAAGSAPSSTTAWLVGRAGLVLTTSDGRTWRRVAFPEAVDLVGVLATDTRVAIVTTADRRTFTTTDGGASWSARKN